jgi:ADP-ribosylglycohydrolase
LSDDPKRAGYNSYGNGSAMRIAPIAYHFDKCTPMLNTAYASANCTHNHPDGIEGGQMVSLALWLARKNESPSDIKQIIEDNSHYTLSFNEESLIQHYYFQPTCQGSVPHALWAALEGPDFETVMRRCLLIGGDTDTIACIAGGLAEILYGIPDEMAHSALAILERDGPFLFDEYMIAIENNPNYMDYRKQKIVTHRKKNMFNSFWLKFVNKP